MSAIRNNWRWVTGIVGLGVALIPNVWPRWADVVVGFCAGVIFIVGIHEKVQQEEEAIRRSE